MQQKQKGSTIGISLILVVFILLCLITFGTLSYLLAKMDNSLSLSAAENTISYYDADATAQETLQDLDAVFATLCPAATSQYDYLLALQVYDMGREDIVVTQTETGILLTFETRATSQEVLVSTLAVNYPAEGTYYTITGWALENKAEDATAG